MSRQNVGFEFCVIILVSSLILGLLMLDRNFSAIHEVRKDEAYAAWCKLTGRTDLSRDELYSLQRAGLLKGYYTVDKHSESK